MPTVTDVGHLAAIDQKRIAANPDALVRVVLRVNGENPARADDDVINVRTPFAHPDGVKHAPRGTELGQLFRDGLLAVGTDPPCSLVSVRAHDPSQHMSHSSLSCSLGHGSFPGRRTRDRAADVPPPHRPRVAGFQLDRACVNASVEAPLLERRRRR
jgi:hypothetical protein